MGGGKTVHVHKLIKDFVSIGTKDIILIVPEQYSFSSERSMLDLLGERNADKAEVLSFTRIAENFFEKSGGEKKKNITDGGRAVLMSLALESVSDKLEIFNRGGDLLITEMLKISSEFKQCAITQTDIGVAADKMDDGFLKSKTKEISLVLSAYDALLAQSFADDKDLLTELYEALGETEYFKNKVVVIDSFKGFTEQEYKIIERILVQSKVTYITLCMDKLFPLDDETSVFAFVKRTAKRLLECAERHNVKVAKPQMLSGINKFCNFPPDFIRYKSQAIAALEKGLYNPSAEIYTEPTEDITICSATDRAAECAFVAQTVKRLIREDGLRCRDIAVIARDIDSYEAPLKTALKKCGVSVFEDKRQPIVTQPLICFVRSAIDVAANGFTFNSVMSCLKTGLTNFNIEEISELENYSVMWQINGKKWLSDFTWHPNGYGTEMTDEDAKKLASINELRKKAVELLERLRADLRDTNGKTAAKSVYMFLDRGNVREHLKQLAISLLDIGETDLATEQERVWDCMMSILDELAETLGDYHVTAKRFGELLNTMISVQSLGSIPQGPDEIAIGGADRIRTTSPRVAFVVGVNDGVFPMSPISGGMFTDKDRKKLQELGLKVADTCKYQIMQERFIAYTALCSASERLFITYPLKSASGEELAQSGLVSQVMRMFPACAVYDASDVQDIDRVEGMQPAFELLCERSCNGGEMYASLYEYFGKSREYSGKLNALEHTIKNLPLRIADKKTAEDLFGKNLYLSASVLESYYKCPFSYFCKYGLRARPVKPAEFDALQHGTAVHNVLEILLRKYGVDGLTALEEAERKKAIKDILDAYLEEKLGGADKPRRFTYLYNRLTDTLNEVVTRLLAEFAQSDFEPVDFELKIDEDGAIKPYTVTTDSGKTVRIRGSIDRVDKMEIDGRAYIRVVDYKSGGKDFRLSDVMNGLNMQMLVYLFAVWQNGGGRYGEVIPSGVLYMSANAPTLPGKRDLSAEEIGKEKIKTCKVTGMVLNDAVVISGMEKGGNGLFIPVREKKDGFSGNLISFEQLGKLRTEVDRAIAGMAEALHDGRIEVFPVSSKSYEKTCEYCEYATACGHEANSPVHKLVDLKHEESLKILDGDGGDGNGG